MRLFPRCSRRILAAAGALVALLTPGRTAGQVHTFADLAQIFAQAADRAAEISPDSVIAIVDRDGRVLVARRANGSAAVTATERATAVAKAGTAVFLSSNDHAFSTRTASFIIQQHFPPGVLNRPTGPLVGVGFSNLAYSDVNYFRETDGSRIPGTRLHGSPGGVPLFKAGVLFAGIGVTGDGTEQEDASIAGADLDEAVALAGQTGYAPPEELHGSHVFIDGIRLAYVASEARLAQTGSGVTLPAFALPPPVVWPTAMLGGVFGEVRAPLMGDPLPGTIGGQPRLTAAEVRQIISNAAARALLTRGGIRLPPGKSARTFISVVNNPAQDGVAPVVLGTFRLPDATIFSWDVSVQKARTAVFFSSNARANSTRTVGFLAQSMYPPGIQNQPPGPFNGLQERFSLPILTGTGTVNPNLPNGITVFPGAFPLYRNGVLVGAIGVSGDGIEQDDLIAAAGTLGFQPDAAIRADAFSYLGARLPYAKFPRDPELRPGEDPLPLPAPLAAMEASRPADIINFSARGRVDNSEPLILGLVVGGTQHPPLLVRGVGPALQAYAIADALPLPGTSLYHQSGAGLATNNAWELAPNPAEIRETAARIGAFPLAPGSPDNALLSAFPAGVYTVMIGTRDGTGGTALAEVYDASTDRVAGSLKNVSIRGRVGATTPFLIAGLVIAEGDARTVLIRGVGPGLAAFGVPAPLAKPRLRILNGSGQAFAEGGAWEEGSNADEIRSATAAVGAFPLADGAGDSALLLSLLPGVYTLQLTGDDGAGGTVLAEIYAVP